MKTPDEIKKWLECCTHGTCNSCPYFGDECDSDREVIDALEYIQQLEHYICEFAEYAAQLEEEQQNLICDFMDYINDGVQNPAPYCAFGESCVLVDKRGWCRPGEHGCNGFVPKVRDDNENAG